MTGAVSPSRVEFGFFLRNLKEMQHNGRLIFPFATSVLHSLLITFKVPI